MRKAKLLILLTFFSLTSFGFEKSDKQSVWLKITAIQQWQYLEVYAGGRTLLLSSVGGGISLSEGNIPPDTANALLFMADRELSVSKGKGSTLYSKEGTVEFFVSGTDGIKKIKYADISPALKTILEAVLGMAERRLTPSSADVRFITTHRVSETQLVELGFNSDTAPVKRAYGISVKYVPVIETAVLERSDKLAEALRSPSSIIMTDAASAKTLNDLIVSAKFEYIDGKYYFRATNGNAFELEIISPGTAE